MMVLQADVCVAQWLERAQEWLQGPLLGQGLQELGQVGLLAGRSTDPMEADIL